jgi:hypothetical protein
LESLLQSVSLDGGAFKESWTNAMNEPVTPQEMAKLIDIRIKLDQFEDSILDWLDKIRTQVIAQNTAEAVDLLDQLIKDLSEDIEE